MLRINPYEGGYDVLRALGSETRMELLIRISDAQTISFSQLLSDVHLSAASLSAQLRQLEDAGLIVSEFVPSTRGRQKLLRLSPNLDRILVDFNLPFRRSVFSAEIPIGQYVDFSATPTCGLAAADGIIGYFDEPRFFTYPARTRAGILWFSTGYVEYMLPTLIANGEIEELDISFEISSEAPGVNPNYPSDISFFINNIPLGAWTCPGDFGEPRGRYNPDWWHPNLNQYGILKILSVTRSGTFLDGAPLAPVTLSDLNLSQPSRFRLAVLPTSPNPGGLTLFGRGFGNHNHGVKVGVTYKE